MMEKTVPRPETAGFTYLEKWQEEGVAQVKRFLEYCSMVPGFASLAKEHPAQAIRTAGVALSETEVRALFPSKDRCAGQEEPAVIQHYKTFLNRKLEYRAYMQKEGCVPAHPAFRRWRERQVNRCWAQFGSRNAGMVHAPVMFELSRGCSMGCPFCGLNAGKLSGVFRHTPENEALWRGVLEALRELVGQAAASGTCYYATEPLDNPDYERWIHDFYNVFSSVPQLTTAAALRNPERTRRLLCEQEKTYRCIHRFSVLSLEKLYEIFSRFTPRELLYTELLPQFPQAPSNHFSRVGRNRDGSPDENPDAETICCVSGLVVNMVERTIRLVSPWGADVPHPTGELEQCRVTFTSAEDFRRKVEAIILRFMRQPFDYGAPLSFYPYLEFEKKEAGFQLVGKSGGTVVFGGFAQGEREAYACVGEQLTGSRLSADELAVKLEGEQGIPPEQTFYVLKDCYQRGVLQMEREAGKTTEWIV